MGELTALAVLCSQSIDHADGRFLVFRRELLQCVNVLSQGRLNRLFYILYRFLPEKVAYRHIKACSHFLQKFRRRASVIAFIKSDYAFSHSDLVSEFLLRDASCFTDFIEAIPEDRALYFDMSLPFRWAWLFCFHGINIKVLADKIPVKYLLR